MTAMAQKQTKPQENLPSPLYTSPSKKDELFSRCFWQLGVSNTPAISGQAEGGGARRVLCLFKTPGHHQLIVRLSWQAPQNTTSHLDPGRDPVMMPRPASVR